MKSIDLKTLLIGLLLGVCVTLSMGQRAAEPQKLDADYRYQISVASNSGGYAIFILDQETKKIYQREIAGLGEQGTDVKRLIGGK